MIFKKINFVLLNNKKYSVKKIPVNLYSFKYIYNKNLSCCSPSNEPLVESVELLIVVADVSEVQKYANFGHITLQ